MLLFVNDEEVVRHGVQYLHLIALMYLLPAVQMEYRGISEESEILRLHCGVVLSIWECV